MLYEVITMTPEADAAIGSRWVLREAGRQFLVYIGTQGPTEVDLARETGIFLVRSVNLRSGVVTDLPDKLVAGTVQDTAPPCRI